MNLQVDLRDVATDKLWQATKHFTARGRVLMTAWQWSQCRRLGAPADLAAKVTVVAPDFLQYARLAGLGRAPEILRLPGSLGAVAAAGVACIPTGVQIFPKLAGGDFWAGALALTRYDVGLLGRRFPGEVLLHPNLADFACFFEKADFLRRFFSMTKNCGARGIATQQVPAVLALCARHNLIPDRLLFPTGITRPEADYLAFARAREFEKTQVTVDFTQWPEELLTMADLHDFTRPGDDAWLLSPQAELAF